MKTISDAELRGILEVETETRSGQYICRCPFCGKESHFYINKRTQAFDCKKCGVNGNIYTLLKMLDKTFLLQGVSVEDTDKIQSIRNVSKETQEAETKVEELPVIKMPVGWRILRNSNAYLLSRRITPELCERYGFGETRLLRKYKQYVLIPIYDGGKIRGFIGRYGAKIVPDDKNRYNNSIHTKFSQLLFGYDDIIQGSTKTLILVEGVFDKIAVDRVLRLDDDESVKCCATFGKKISPEQISKIKQKDVENVILLYDFDAIREIKKYGLELQKEFTTSIVYTTKKDIDECTDAEALAVFNNMYSPQDFNMDVIGKLKK